jgi:hypothetical protein
MTKPVWPASSMPLMTLQRCSEQLLKAHRAAALRIGHSNLCLLRGWQLLLVIHQTIQSQVRLQQAIEIAAGVKSKQIAAKVKI